MESLDAELARVAAVLLEDRVVRRVIKQHRRLHGVGLQVPHARCYPLPRADLLALVGRHELQVDPEALPANLVIFGGSRAHLAAGDRSELARAWRAIFHGHVHLAFDRLYAAHAITPTSVRERIHRIGQTEFDEIRWVLRQEDLLLPPGDDAAAYAEFVALYLELQQFAPVALERTFPTLDAARVDQAIALDLDAAALVAGSRPARAPEWPIDRSTGRPITDASPIVVREVAAPVVVVDGAARVQAARARSRGNRARAAILALRAGDDAQACGDLDELGARLARALGLGGAETDWTRALLPVAALAASQRVLRFTASARLLHDLQTACVVAERETKRVDPVAWALSRGQRPIVRSLPATREVRIAKHLHAAADKLAGCELPTADHARLTAAIRAIALRGDANVRTALRPKIEAALDEVDLHPHNLPERVAEKKLVDELLDQVVAGGRVSIGNLRDAISHNDLKMPDLERRQLRTGDALLRCDHALSRSLDGVYLRGEGYLRFLQKLSSVLFGTPAGRFLSLYIILPLLGSYTVFKGAQEMVDLVAKHTHRAARELISIDVLPPDAAELVRWISRAAHDTHHAAPEIATAPLILGGAVVLFQLLHVPRFRGAAMFCLRILGRGIRLLVLDAPRAVFRRPVVRRFLASWFVRWLVEPAIPAALGLVVTDGLLRWPIAGGLFIVLAVGLNSRWGRTAQEILADGLVRTGQQLSRIIPGAIRWILDAFAEAKELVDRALYRVDEWLRFKTGESRLTLVIKGVLGTVWSAVAYFLRLYVNLFIEPGVNPIKHFPVVTVTAKLMVPFYETMLAAIRGPAEQLMGRALGTSFAAFTVFVIPGIAGFLVWELKENWKLYRETRPKTLREVSIGHHGETLVGFLKPGFHSGTIPKRFTRLRRAAWKSDERAVARHREALHHLEEAIHKFADRELVSMLSEAAAFRCADIAAGSVTIGSNRAQIELVCPSRSPQAARIVFEHTTGWTVASVPQRGWIDRLDDVEHHIFETALAGFYKRAGVDLVREQLEQVLAGDDEPPPYDLPADSLIVWPGRGYQTEAVYDLRAPSPTPKLSGEPWAGELPSLAGRHALYFRELLGWASWTKVWEQLARGEQPMQIILGPPLVRRPPLRATALAV
jgi:hypothetical protein